MRFPLLPNSRRTSLFVRTEALTPDRVNELKQNEDIIQLLYVAEQYLGKTLSPTEIQKMLFFYDGLGMSADLIEYLIEYCVGHNHKSIRYIEKVALAWAEEGITSVEIAKQSGSRYNKDYFSILKALGITNRNPVETEITLMDTWLRTTMAFPWTSSRKPATVPSFRQVRPASSIQTRFSEGWKKEDVHTIDDIHTLDIRTQETPSGPKARHPPNLHSLPITVSITSSSENTTSTNYEKHLLNQLKLP